MANFLVSVLFTYWYVECIYRLADAHLQLDNTKNMSATTLLATEDEILQLKAE